MSLSCAENSASDANPAPVRRPWSLTLWFTLCNALSSFLILALIAMALYLGLVTQLKSQNHLYLHDEVNMLETVISTEGNGATLAHEANPDQSGEEYVKHYIRLLNGKERIIAETAGMSKVAPHQKFTPPVRNGRAGVDEQWRNAGGCLLLGTSEWVVLGRGTGEQGILEVALDVTNVQSILDGYRHKIYGALVLGFLLSFGGSVAIARRGTRPMREMTEAVGRISVANLEERISLTDLPEELKILAVTMNLMLGRLQHSFQRLYNSARNLSHKMRTPLTILRGEAEVALSRTRSVEELQDVIVSGLEENGRLVRLIDNILFLADAEIGKFDCITCAMDASHEIEKILDFYSPAAEDKGITLSCQGNVCVMADASLFRRAVSALLSNAIIYSDPGGRVDLDLRLGEGGMGELCVNDSGCGFDQCEMEKVFDRFYRIYATRHRDPHGTGLGLPIAKAIMELQGGSIGIQSRPGQGTAVTLRFPTATD